MNRGEKKRKDELVDDEKAFTDLLFGDVKEVESIEVTQADNENKRERLALWHDSDDDELRVDLQRVALNRKLRKNEEENEITGGELSKRLRTQ